MLVRSLVTGRALAYAALVAAPVVLTLKSIADAGVGYDMRVALLPAADRILEGVSPFDGLTYPPLIPFLLVPFTFVPRPDVVLGFMAMACVPMTLWLLKVRDWRCHAAALLWGPVHSGFVTGNPTLFLILGCALAFRHRTSVAIGATSIGLAIAAKAITLPFAVWLFATRRPRTALTAVLVAIGSTAALVAVDAIALARESGGWGIVTVPGSASTPSYGIADIVRALGGNTLLGLGVIAIAVGLLTVQIVRVGRRGDDIGAFCGAAVATLMAAPNVLLYSFSFLLLAVAVRRPRFSPVWLAPALLAFRPVIEPTWFDMLLVWGVAGAVITVVLTNGAWPAPRPWRSDPSRDPARG